MITIIKYINLKLIKLKKIYYLKNKFKFFKFIITLVKNFILG